ncbi:MULTISPECIES: LemA family protein [unclassified Sphingomonas]|uniref:LemA family protein n=1 Tax=unclassified Sphingomonas TaxID=196159 RepID=UPI00160CC40F|nr:MULTISPECIES: LemA family protein [unclassified Sphingomonas]MBB3347960.1 LemA protein [Sphingomonas sp. BK069]MBB3473959.1 LemA protein [Sphingomonas sp. BK345]
MMHRRAAALVMALPLAACGVNSVPTAEENAKARWADVQNEYQRRADLIPNLVATVKGYAKQESDVLTRVTEARASANRVQVSGDQLSDPAAVQRYAAAQNAVTLSLQRLQEAYPDLKSNQNFLSLQSQLEGTENRITVARRDYNQAVQDYNTRIRTFPDAVGAKIFYGAKPLVPFQATSPGAEQAPTVNFGS